MVGAGVTFDPVTVMTMVRPAGLELLDELGELSDVDEVEELVEELVVTLGAASPPEPPHAASVRARARPVAHGMGARRVIFVTNPSLDSAF